MLDLRFGSQFKRDRRLCIKRGYDMVLLETVVDTLRIPALLSAQNKDHSLSGNWAGYKECHVSPDWLLIYQVKGNELRLVRTGTHADLFGS